MCGVFGFSLHLSVSFCGIKSSYAVLVGYWIIYFKMLCVVRETDNFCEVCGLLTLNHCLLFCRVKVQIDCFQQNPTMK